MFFIHLTMRRQKKNVGQMSLAMAVISLLVCSQAMAHNVTVFAWVDGETVHVESKFSGGRKPVAAPVEVYDSQGNLLLKGVTDDNGEFSFKVPEITEMKVILQAGMGHKGEWTILLSDLEGVGIDTPPQTAETDAKPPVATASDQAMTAALGGGGNSDPAGYVSTAQIQEVVEEALDKKLQPVMKLLVDTRQSGPSVNDILGGIGYIFGLIGVAAYFSTRRRKS
jgi:nickel transport protein